MVYIFFSVRFHVILLMLFQYNRRLAVVSFCLKLSRRLKAKKNIAGKRCMHQPKQNETNVNIQNILTAHSSDESTLTDESLNS